MTGCKWMWYGTHFSVIQWHLSRFGLVCCDVPTIWVICVVRSDQPSSITLSGRWMWPSTSILISLPTTLNSIRSWFCFNANASNGVCSAFIAFCEMSNNFSVLFFAKTSAIAFTHEMFDPILFHPKSNMINCSLFTKYLQNSVISYPLKLLKPNYNSVIVVPLLNYSYNEWPVIVLRPLWFTLRYLIIGTYFKHFENKILPPLSPNLTFSKFKWYIALVLT